MTACGKKGPPLPPLVRLPQPPSELTATRRGDTVDLQFNVPSANTDGSRPANVERVDVYAFSGPDVKDEELFKRDPKIGSVAVKAPKDPNVVVEEDEPVADMEPPEGAGLEQGAKARIEETLTAASLVPLEVPKEKARKKPASIEDVPQPLVGPPLQIPARTYVAVSVNKHGQRGPMTPRRLVPLAPAPPAPVTPAVTYDESAITVSWQAPSGIARMREPASGDILPSRLVGYVEPSIGYNVYEVPPATPPGDATDAAKSPKTPAADKPTETRLTGAPVDEPTYDDTRMSWGTERCYAVRTVERIGELSVESADAPTGVHQARRHVSAGRAQRSAVGGHRGRGQPDLAGQQREGSRRLHRAARHDARHARADHARADPGNRVQGRGAGRGRTSFTPSRRSTKPATSADRRTRKKRRRADVGMI